MIAIDADNSVIISLLPLGTEKTYPLIGAARMSRFEPPLGVYKRVTRFDTIPLC